jgi:hypothetical protein
MLAHITLEVSQHDVICDVQLAYVEIPSDTPLWE